MIDITLVKSLIREHLSYQMPEKPFEIFEEDFFKTLMDYEMYKRGIDSREFDDKLLQKVLYGSGVKQENDGISIKIKKEQDE